MLNGTQLKKQEDMRFEELQREVNGLKAAFGLGGGASQLKFPLDFVTKKLIEDLIVLPVTVNLKSTEPATAANYSTFFTADRPFVVIGMTEVHGTAGTNGSPVTLQLERLQGTEALDAGDEILSAVINLKGTANTVQYATLKTSGVQFLSRGDRLALKDAGTLTDVANVQVTVYLQYA